MWYFIFDKADNVIGREKPVTAWEHNTDNIISVEVRLLEYYDDIDVDLINRVMYPHVVRFVLREKKANKQSYFTL